MDALTPLSALRGCILFEGVDDAALERLAMTAQPLRLDSGQQVFASGDRAERFYALISGEVQLYRPSFGGEDILFQILGAGELLSEAAMFLVPSRYPLTARTSKETRLYAYSREALLALCDAAPGLMHTLLAALAKRLYQAVNRIENLSLNNAGQRLVSYLLQLHRHQGARWINMPVNIDLPVNIAVLAGQLAMTPETLSRLLQKFRQQGLLSGKGRTLVLLDPAGLCDCVGLAPPEDVGEVMPPMVGCCGLGSTRR
ncbi:CRP-like cAMP-binding protein [Paucibacter oligotrophus]|uniref:CRP-like cAMP-binding protein n=1 Tax=Roseateles oligotrophus TaxID=1769250 RepID=A0A840LAW5_9BURK|nr:Crp/Fnr family transcriptional regulator [Roseateles oligotrophus]MBB4845286.1 CRP-like cAMP-binding protein [Roseateles oligotrophus]